MRKMCLLILVDFFAQQSPNYFNAPFESRIEIGDDIIKIEIEIFASRDRSPFVSSAFFLQLTTYLCQKIFRNNLVEL